MRSTLPNGPRPITHGARNKPSDGSPGNSWEHARIGSTIEIDGFTFPFRPVS